MLPKWQHVICFSEQSCLRAHVVTSIKFKKARVIKKNEDKKENTKRERPLHAIRCSSTRASKNYPGKQMCLPRLRRCLGYLHGASSLFLDAAVYKRDKGRCNSWGGILIAVNKRKGEGVRSLGAIKFTTPCLRFRYWLR